VLFQSSFIDCHWNMLRSQVLTERKDHEQVLQELHREKGKNAILEQNLKENKQDLEKEKRNVVATKVDHELRQLPNQVMLLVVQKSEQDRKQDAIQDDFEIVEAPEEESGDLKDNLQSILKSILFSHDRFVMNIPEIDCSAETSILWSSVEFNMYSRRVLRLYSDLYVVLQSLKEMFRKENVEDTSFHTRVRKFIVKSMNANEWNMMKDSFLDPT
jgi:hypothetical protein